MDRGTKALCALFFLSAVSSEARSECPMAKMRVEAKCAETLASDVAIALSRSSDDPEIKLEAATTYLKSLPSSDAISEDRANAFIGSLKPLCQDSALSAGLRSKVCLTLSGLHGKLADKAEMGGLEDGQNFFKFLNLAMDQDPNNREAALTHANAVVEIYQQGILKRNLAESMLRIKLVEQAQAAKRRFMLLNLTGDPLYSALSEISQSE